MSKPTSLAGLEKQHAELQRLINRSSLTIDPLVSDFSHAVGQWRQDRTSQFWSRTAIRCLCAAVEARLFTFRKMAEEMALVSGVQFNREEVEILTEQKASIGPKGILTTRPGFIPFPDSVKESFRLFGKAVGATITIDYGVAGFSMLCKTFEVRNRLMHPKQPFDVQVSTQDVDTADHGIGWFSDAYGKVMEECHAHIGHTIAAMMKSHGA